MCLEILFTEGLALKKALLEINGTEKKLVNKTPTERRQKQTEN